MRNEKGEEETGSRNVRKKREAIICEMESENPNQLKPKVTQFQTRQSKFEVTNDPGKWFEVEPIDVF